MNRYLVFAGDHYYPAGGFYDFIGDFSDVEEAKKIAKLKSYDWAHIIDSQTKEEVKDGK